MNNNIVKNIIEKRRKKVSCGIPSFCTANPLVIEACFQQGIRFNDGVLIEATANQVNQYGGYTGMCPADFRDMVYSLAQKVDFPIENIILGGDHLGPLTWCNEEEASAMDKAEVLVREFVTAGYKKIHLDTSMRLGDDPQTEPLSLKKIAHRGARLYKACEEEYLKLLQMNPDESRPVYVIGSEVPIPGGEQCEADTISITTVDDLEATLSAYKAAFAEYGCADAMENVVAIVVQPGVEFGDENVAFYDRIKTIELCHAVQKYPGLVMEGHSTDYQPTSRLREMVVDGIAILKVGPALTYALREALFALNMIEKELIPYERQSHFRSVLESVMLENDVNWKKYYRGSEHEVHLKRRYSLSDRCRYYMLEPRVVAAMNLLFINIDNVKVPHGLLRQFMPNEFVKIREGEIPCIASEMVKSHIIDVIEEYNYATKYNYINRHIGY